MTAVAIPLGEQSFFLTKVDVNGQPYTVPNAGGFVYMYQPGSTVPQTTWLDSAQTTANVDPIRLDPNGRCVIYGVGQYRQLVTDAHGNVQWDQLTELGVDPSFVSDTIINTPVLVAGPNPNPPLNTQDQGTRSLAAVLGSFVDARNGRFGALRQGGDDLVVIQAAVNYAASIGGATVYLGPGPLTTAAGTTLTWPAGANGVSLRGDGPQATLLNINGALTTDVIALTAPGGLAYCQIRDMGFSANSTGTNGNLIHLTDTLATVIDNVNMLGGFWHGIFVEGGGSNNNQITIRDLTCNAAASANTCIIVGADNTGSAQNVVIDGCELRSSAYGIYLRNVNDVKITNTECINHSQNGIATQPAPFNIVNFVYMTGVVVDGCAGAGILIGDQGGNTSLVSMNNCLSASNLIGVLIQPFTREGGVSITGCQLALNQHEGIFNSGASGMLASNNIVTGNGTAAANTYDSISVNGGVQSVVTGNFIGPVAGYPATHRYGIALLNTADYCVITGNVIGSSGTGLINNASTGTHNVVLNNTGT